jgi:prepilin-type N-terminal cleavage/methylation domain-containing protein
MLGLKRHSSRQAHAGVTLLEVMLVLAIGSAIVYMSIQQYLSYRKDADAVAVKANVNAIFQAMSAYYRKNCYGFTEDGTMTAADYGTLNPANPTSPGNNKYIDIQADLITPGLFWKAGAATNLVRNPLIDDAGAISASLLGYVAQFNKVDPNPQRQVCTDGTGTAPTTPPTTPAETPIPTCTASVNTGQIVIWKVQVAAKLKDTANAAAYLNLLAGDCLSSPGPGGIINPCSSNTPGDYVVWERLPSSANTEALSTYWETVPTVNQFTLMYRTEPILNLTNGFKADSQYYVCGN